MKKVEFLEGLEGHIRSGNRMALGEKVFAQFFHFWLSKLFIPSDDKYDFFRVDPYLPQLAVDAWETLRTGTDEETVRFRHAYECDTGWRIGNIMDLGCDSGTQQISGMFTLRSVLSAVMSKDSQIGSEVETYCSAQKQALQGLFDKFIRQVYRKGLFQIISDDRSRGMKGSFGPTELRTFVCAGRTMFTFARPKKRGPEVSVSFVAGDDDDLALEAGIQSVEANLPTAFYMIEDVISRWPDSTEDQKKLFKADSKVCFG